MKNLNAFILLLGCTLGFSSCMNDCGLPDLVGEFYVTTADVFVDEPIELNVLISDLNLNVETRDCFSSLDDFTIKVTIEYFEDLDDLEGEEVFVAFREVIGADVSTEGHAEAFQVQFDKTGVYTFCVNVDLYNNIEETNELNNKCSIDTPPTRFIIQ